MLIKKMFSGKMVKIFYIERECWKGHNSFIRHQYLKLDFSILITYYIQKLKINKKMNMPALESRVIHATKNDQD